MARFGLALLAAEDLRVAFLRGAFFRAADLRLVDGSPQAVLLTVDLYENFIHEESIAITPVFTLQSAGINGTELDAPQAYRLAGDGHASFCQEVLDITMAKVKAVIQPNRLAEDDRRESVAFVGIHRPILSSWAS